MYKLTEYFEYARVNHGEFPTIEAAETFRDSLEDVGGEFIIKEDFNG